MDKNREFQKRILATFKLEAEENIQLVSSLLIELEKAPVFAGNEDLFERLYRSAHSLKGASRAVGLGDIESLCHALEDVFSAIRNGEIGISKNTVDAFFATLDLLEDLVKNSGMDENPELAEAVSNHLEILTLVEIGETVEIPKRNADVVTKSKTTVEPTQSVPEKIAPGLPEAERPANKPKKNVQQKNDTIRISAHKLDDFLTQVEELLPLKLTANKQAEDLHQIINSFSSWKKQVSSVKTNSFDLKKFEAVFDENKTHLNETEKQLHELLNLARQEAYLATQKIESLLNDVKALLTVPFSLLFDGFPKMVRDMANDLGKEVEFSIEGDSIEIDRRILEEMRNPLTHLLRNAVDYGVEAPEVKIQKNKNRKGKIAVKIEQTENNKVSIWISDDGPGLNFGKLHEMYLDEEHKKGNSSPGEISEKELAAFIFKSGVSTSEIISDISGRGLGMAIVQETVERLGGNIIVNSEKNKGTTFEINLPLSIVTFRGVVIESAGQTYIVPTFKVKQIVQVDPNSIKTIKNKASVTVNGEIIPLFDLAQTLETAITKKPKKGKLTTIIFDVKGKRNGFVIDRVIGEQEVLVKNFNRQLTRVRNILGATVLGANQVVPVLNVSDLYLSAEKNNYGLNKNSNSAKKQEERKKSVLIVEDSITSRTLLKNIVESAGYKVSVAVDGIDGFTKLKTGIFDVVISDVEMPRMNGFELTQKIKTDESLNKTPVILVTSLSKPEHREKGVEVGANAYIIKSNFEQGTLIEAIERFI